MSSFWKKTMIWLGLEDEEPDQSALSGRSVTAVEQEAVGGASVLPAQSSGEGVGQAAEAPGAHPYVVSTYRPQGAESEGFEAGSGVRMLPPTETRVWVMEPTGFNDAQELGEHFRQGDPVLMDLSDADRDTARRLVDFASGLTYGLRGRMRKVGDHAFLLMPAHASVAEEEWERIRSLGYDV